MSADRCRACRKEVARDWSADECEHGALVCQFCTFVDGCATCAEMEGAA